MFNRLKSGLVENRDGVHVQATLQSVTAAVDSLKDIPDDLRFSVINAPGAASYPICGTCWAIVYLDQPPGKKPVLVDFLRWVTGPGQKFCPQLGYAPLPTSLVQRIHAKIDQIKSK